MTNVIDEGTPTKVTECSHCHGAILVGEQVTSITVSEEKFVSISALEVLTAKATHMFCVGCARAYNFKAIIIPRSALMTRQESAEMDAMIAESYRDCAAKALAVDPKSLTIEQITVWRLEQEALEHGF